MKHTFGTKKIYIYICNQHINCLCMTDNASTGLHFPHILPRVIFACPEKTFDSFFIAAVHWQAWQRKKNSFLGCFHNINRHVQPINILHLPLRQWIMWHRMYWEGRSKVNSSTCVRKWHGVLDRCIRSCHNCDVCEERGSFFHQRDKPNDQLWREPLGAVRPIAGRMVMEG